MADLSLEDITPMMGVYAERVASWKVDHDEAMRCRDLESDVTLGVALFLHIDVVDMTWRSAVLDGKEEYDALEEQAIEGLYRDWFATSGFVLARIEKMEAAGYTIRWADQFRRAHREAKAIATSDEEFFSGDALISLRDSAIDAHREGLTVDFHELGD